MRHFNDLRPLAAVTVLLLIAPRCPAREPPAAPAQRATLADRLDGHLAQPRFAGATWGIKIVSLDTGKTVYEHNARKLLQPASNAKLYSGALALDRLGPDYRIRTSLSAAQKPDASGILEGDLLVYGRGDPSFAVRFEGVAYTNLLDPLAQSLVAAGVKRIRGDLIGDESYFRGPPFGSGWSWDDLQYYYGAAVSALTVQDNVVDLEFKPGANPGDPCRFTAWPPLSELVFINRTVTTQQGTRRSLDPQRLPGQVTVILTGQMPVDDQGRWEGASVPRPAHWFLMLFQQALTRHGIEVSGKLRTVDWREREKQPVDYPKLVELGSVLSPPMSELVAKMMKPSQNLYAQLLLLQAGKLREKPENASQTSEELGLAELNQFLAEAGIPKGEAVLEEGSGLSRGTRVTPNATATLLQHMAQHRYAEAFRATLPIAGVDGSLRSRFKGTAAEKNVRAKTGSFRWVNTLSGYVTTKGGESLAFSLMLNGHGGASARADLDEIAVMLAEMNSAVAE
jgi:D-alanyl-D-alanine carboxypeptidase/D-alanyl-D-alanine-endopeptidase (penicillin-binding protein 4)